VTVRKLRGDDGAHVGERAIPIVATDRLEDVVAEAVENQLPLVDLDAMKRRVAMSDVGGVCGSAESIGSLLSYLR
jgi:hypothetical protein